MVSENPWLTAGPIPTDSLASCETIPFLSLRRVYKRAGSRYDPPMISRSVLLFGQSLLLSLVAASLEQSPGLRVAQARTWADARRVLAEHIPDVLIFDLTDAGESHLLPLLFKNPRLLLVGLDVETNQAVLLSGKEAQSLTLNQIKEIIESR